MSAPAILALVTAVATSTQAFTPEVGQAYRAEMFEWRKAARSSLERLYERNAIIQTDERELEAAKDRELRAAATPPAEPVECVSAPWGGWPYVIGAAILGAATVGYVMGRGL